MFGRIKTYTCPVCKSNLGTHSTNQIVIVTCDDEDCKVKWCFKPGAKLPTAIDYPGLKLPKRCMCEGCKSRK